MLTFAGGFSFWIVKLNVLIRIIMKLPGFNIRLRIVMLIDEIQKILLASDEFYI